MKSPKNDEAVFRSSHKSWKLMKAYSHIPTAAAKGMNISSNRSARDARSEGKVNNRESPAIVG